MLVQNFQQLLQPVLLHAVITNVVTCSLFLLAIIMVLFNWQDAALVLNACRRFRYTLDLKKDEEKEQIRRKIRAHAQVIRVYQSYVSAMYFLYHATLFLFDGFSFEYNQAALLFKEAGEERNGRELPGNCYGEWMPFRVAEKTECQSLSCNYH